MGRPLEISEQESNMVKMGIKPYPTEGKLAVFLKHNGKSPKLPFITHFKCFLVSNLNLFCCNQSPICLIEVGKQLDKSQ